MTASVHKRILVVDDDPDQAELLATALGGRDREVRAFTDPIRALASLSSEPADLLVADLSMPWVDGAQVISRARAQFPLLAIILISGYSRGAHVAARIGLPFFPKPIDLDRLQVAVDRLLEQSTSSAALPDPSV
jgi:two-component system response regulator TctD